MEIYRKLNKGKWERPSDKMAVYTEIEKGKTWGIRVTLIDDYARVEAINGPKCVWYNAPPELSAEVRPPSILERIRGITFADKLFAEVEQKREVARRKSL
ncbi:MAG: hypothetical protein WBH35_07230 [Bacillota bacterium]|nr:hypothetical protein [Bacillota bacterium]HOB90406.1 hypothetical protein [Bacillota bacterium]HPZ53854.1 hypothetical protein [Bacillota bacterium]HQD17363.1 hypothetical protein [Bacillota bacterium]